MGTSRRDMYKFVWDEGEDPDTETAQTSPKDIVANILKETELPDLNLNTESNASHKSTNKKGLDTEQELFSIDDDDDYDFEQTFNISGRVSQKEASKAKDNNKHKTGHTYPSTSNQRSGGGLSRHGHQEPVTYSQHTPNSKLLTSTKTYERKSPAKVPPLVSVQHPTLTHLEEGVVPGLYSTNQDQRDNNNEDTERKNKTGHKSALLPLDMEMDDDADSGVADTDTHTDTQPIVTLDQSKLAARWRTRRQKTNFFVALGLVILGVVVLTVVLIVMIKVLRSK